MPIGDVNSTERGTGARFNDGKLPLELIPVRIWLDAYEVHLPASVVMALTELAKFQEGDNDGINRALSVVRHYIPDAARVLDYGRKKYAEWNWAKGMPWSVCIGCILRHAQAVASGEVLDPESGISHAGHIACNLIFLTHYARCYPEGDDRPNTEWMNPPREGTNG